MKTSKDQNSMSRTLKMITGIFIDLERLINR
jgi:hypothetical protein